MRLLKAEADGRVVLIECFPPNIPKYAILSHTWGPPDQEVTFQDISDGTAASKKEYRKIKFCQKQTAADDLQYFWIDTCCIDKTSSAELTEAINSMFQWYREAQHCYVYLSDVSAVTDDGRQPDPALRLWDTQFRQSNWFKRGWTLQELLAPGSVKFFSVQGDILGNRMSLKNVIHTVTNIEVSALDGRPLYDFPVHKRLQWSSSRTTMKEEDAAYCLLGIFGVYLPLIYGEGKTSAMNRMLKVVEEKFGPSNDLSPTQSSNLSFVAPMSIEEAHILVPFGRNDEFVGRESVLRELVVKILPSGNNKNCQRTVLEGLGGVGKTQIALEAAYRVFEQSPNCSIFWVPALSLVMFENAYRDIGEALGTPGMDDDNADIKELVKTTLERSKGDWLLIIDNIDDIGLLTRDKGLKSCLPFNRKGSILFTTRNHEVAVRLNISKKHTFVVEKMSEAEAVQLLQNELKERQYRDTQATKDLVQHLVFLPLAVKQASAYMARTRITTAVYHKLCRGSDNAQIKLLNTGFEELQRYSDNTNPITLTWLISFQHLAESYLLAIEYLKFVCLLAEKDIPMSLLPIGKDEEALPEAIGILEGYAFVSIHEQGDSFDMHRLVRLVTRNWIKNDWEAYYAKVVHQLAKVYPVPKHDNRQLWTRYMPHAQVAIELHRECIDKKAAADLLFVVADSYNELGRYKEAEQMHRQTLELTKSVLGGEHPSTLNSMNNLALVFNSLGRYKEAEQMHRQTLELTKSVLGLEHPSTLDSMNNLASVLGSLGRYEEAEQMHRQTLELTKSVLGGEHPSTLDSMNNLASVLDSLGRYEEAEQMHRQTLELTKSVLGGEHPSTLDSMNNLASVLDSLGRYEEAEQMHRQTLELTKSVLGGEHPSTLDSMNNLASVLDSLGRYEEAEQMHRQTLELNKSVLGGEHPSTLSSMNNLASVLGSLGRYEEAEQMHRQTLELKKSVLGPGHPSTIRSRNNLQNLLDSIHVGGDDDQSTSPSESEDEGEGGTTL